MAKTGITQDMITKLRDGGQKKALTTTHTHTHTQKKRCVERKEEKVCVRVEM